MIIISCLRHLHMADGKPELRLASYFAEPVLIIRSNGFTG